MNKIPYIKFEFKNTFLGCMPKNSLQNWSKNRNNKAKEPSNVNERFWTSKMVTVVGFLKIIYLHNIPYVQNFFNTMVSAFVIEIELRFQLP